MTRVRIIAVAAFLGAVAAGTWLDGQARAGLPRRDAVLAADLHVHPYPGDGTLTLWQLQREAARRGVDVVAATGHNNQFAVRVGRAIGIDPDGPIILPGQELTAPEFHIVAIGIHDLVDWQLSAPEAIAAIHAQGGVAIAAHPTADYRLPDDALRRLDGAELAHPLTLTAQRRRQELDDFFARATALNPGLAPIGSTDFHTTAPLGLCRTYLLVDERSAAGALDAIRRGRTVAADAEGRLFGSAEHVARVEEHLAATVSSNGAVSLREKVSALAALLALAVGILPSGRE